MNDMNDELGQALSENGHYDEEKAMEARKVLRQKFEAGYLRIERMMCSYLLLATAVVAYCALRLLRSGNAQDSVLFGAVLLVFLLRQGSVKLWFWVMNTKISVLKEIKLLRLALASGGGHVDDVDERELHQLLFKPVAHGRGGTKTERSLWYVATVVVALACGLLGNADGYRKNMVASVSARELAVWTFDASDTVTARSEIRIHESSSCLSQLLTLPYASGQVQSVTLNGQDADFVAVGKGEYQVEMPDALFMKEKVLEIEWTFPFSVFELKDQMYRTVLRPLMPVRAYMLKVGLTEDSKYAFGDWPGAAKGTPFYASFNTPRQTLGSCGLGIKALEKTGPLSSVSGYAKPRGLAFICPELEEKHV